MPTSYDHHWPLFKAWKDWKAACLGFADSDVCSGHELNRRAIYLGIPVAQLRWVSSYRPDPVSLLDRRMEALSLNPVEVTHMTPFQVRELQHRCVMCAKREQCALDLADKFADPDWRYWRGYCPNAEALTTLAVNKRPTPPSLGGSLV